MKPRPALLLRLLLLLLPAAGALGQPAGYYRSNAIGLALAPLPGFSRQEEYLLRVQREGEREIRTLYEEGRELRRWELSPGLERVFSRGSQEEERSFDGAGRLASENTYEKGRLQQTAQYRYGLSGLSAVETYGADGTLLARERYELGPGGELRRVRRESPEPGPDRQAQEELALVAADGRLFEERLAAGGRRLVSRYGPDGKLASSQIWQGRELLETLELAYAGTLLQSSERTASGARTVTRYDAEGREASRRLTRGGKTVEDWSFRYDAGGRRLLATRVHERGSEQWSYSYDAGGSLQLEEYRARGQLEKVVRYAGEGARVEELYRAGLLFMVVSYRGGVKVLEEFVEGGQVVRRREFEGGP
jgi:YD repeat-containing protein